MNIFFEILKQGLGYLQIWPQQKVLNCLFIDSKVVFYTRFAMKITPIFILLSIVFSSLMVVTLHPATTITFILFLLSMPLQGLYWLGHRSQTFLPSQLLSWYAAIEKVLNSQYKKDRVMGHRPRYIDLALLLKNAFKQGGDNFLQNNELI